MSNGNGNDVSKWTKWAKLAVVVVGLFLSIGGVMWGVETRYAKADDITIMTQAIAGNAKNIQAVRVENQIRRVYERIWMLEKQYGIGCQSCPTEYRQEHNRLKLDVENLKRRLRKLES